MKNFFYMLFIMLPKIKGKYTDIDDMMMKLKWKYNKTKSNGNRLYNFKVKNVKY